MEDQIILVDKKDNQVGTEGKLAAHQKALLHRAFSIYIFNDKGEVLIQRRNKNKYHSGGLWSNTCCSHPRDEEDIELAIYRRLKEEMDFDCEMRKIFDILYRCEFDNGLTENEFLHVFVGKYSGEVTANPEEAEAWKWMNATDLLVDVKTNPEKYSYWLIKCIEKVLENAP
ncbi:MAG: isopentenyl-diphosphate Delta-isomerase [Candidatus Woesearchaeota archaeon]|jgi:isopentenyl-diphosphate delta-isomerase|nr:isopentenyl-diphosphate Delta-isomerase [Candidatus Woesearchaeota archaeon]MDP7458571.1 isopentenyl-diphosphate Delta-isomerase [Candidatus Woesearchaeota archaeon]|tara:strand:+ start:119 stop:631 length:513 start_codon:yes stop_codon:yes gene_type:complete